MCLAIPGRIVAMDAGTSDLAVAEVGGVKRPVNVGLLSDQNVGAGDWVLIHVGFAMSKVDEAEARATMAFLEGLGQAYEDEIRAFVGADAETDGGGGTAPPGFADDADDGGGR